jgi:hypothetical protein
MGDGREADQSSDVHNLGLNLFTFRPAKDGKVLDSWYARHQDRDLALKDRDLTCQDQELVTKRDSRCWKDDGSELMHAKDVGATTNSRGECADKHVVPRQGHRSAHANDARRRTMVNGATSLWALGVSYSQ